MCDAPSYVTASSLGDKKEQEIDQSLDDDVTELEHNQYTVKTTGLVHSIVILRLLFGHPDFFSQICDQFSIMPFTGEDQNCEANAGHNLD